MDTIPQVEQAAPVSEEQENLYSPRPMWQVWGARVGLVLFLLFVLWQLIQIAGGGL